MRVITLICCLAANLSGQNYTSYFVSRGDSVGDVVHIMRQAYGGVDEDRLREKLRAVNPHLEQVKWTDDGSIIPPDDIVVIPELTLRAFVWFSCREFNPLHEALAKWTAGNAMQRVKSDLRDFYRNGHTNHFGFAELHHREHIIFFHSSGGAYASNLLTGVKRPRPELENLSTFDLNFLLAFRETPEYKEYLKEVALRARRRQ